jgi:hypothetical protein
MSQTTHTTVGPKEPLGAHLLGRQRVAQPTPPAVCAACRRRPRMVADQLLRHIAKLAIENAHDGEGTPYGCKTR